MTPTTTTPRTPTVMESMHNSQINSKNARSRRRMIDTNSAPCTRTGLRHCADAYKRDVPIPIFRASSFGSNALSCCTPDYRDGIARSVSSSSSSSVTSSSNLESTMNNSIRSVNLFDLIDEEFVVNCGASLGNRCEIDERMKGGIVSVVILPRDLFIDNERAFSTWSTVSARRLKMTTKLILQWWQRGRILEEFTWFLRKNEKQSL